MVKQVIILKGLMGSGKTTWAKEQIDVHHGQFKRVNKDDLRAMLDNGRHSHGNENMVLRVRDFLILESLNSGHSVICDDTNFEPRHEERIREIVTQWNVDKAHRGSKERAEVNVKFFDVPLEECIARDKLRPNSVGEEIIRAMYNKYLRKDLPKIEHNPALPDAIICDIDGTLALHNGRSPYDFEKCENDLLNESVAEILSQFDYPDNINNFKFILVSGREEKYREKTEKWLGEKLVHFDVLYMRKTDDMRQDTVIKQEIYEQYIKDCYNVLFVLDDRLRVCRMWHSLGLPLLRVGDPDADF